MYSCTCIELLYPMAVIKTQCFQGWPRPWLAEVGHDAAWAAQMAHAGHGGSARHHYSEVGIWPTKKTWNKTYQQIGIELRLNWDPKTAKICLVKHCSNIARSNFGHYLHCLRPCVVRGQRDGGWEGFQKKGRRWGFQWDFNHQRSERWGATGIIMGFFHKKLLHPTL